MTSRIEIAGNVMRELSRIGPRPHGSVANENALDFVATRLDELGWKTVHEPFKAPCPQPRAGADLSVAGRRIPCMPFLESRAGRASGILERAGDCLVWGMHRWDLWKIVSSDPAGWIAVSSFPTAVQQHIPASIAGEPAVVVSAADFSAGVDSLRGEPATLEMHLPLVEREGYSLRAYPERDPLDEAGPHAFIVAHIDTVPDSPGIYDNAAGVAAAVALAAELTNQARTQLLITSGEEEGLAGARAFITAAQGRLGPPRDTFACVLDGGGRGRLAEAWLSGGTSDSVVASRFREHAARNGYDSVVTVPAPPASDHAAFSEAGMPAVMFTVNDLEILHTPEDVFEDSKVESSVLLAELASATLDIPHEQLGMMAGADR